MTHDTLIARAQQAISDLAADTSVSKKQTIADLKDLRDEIEIRLDALEQEKPHGTHG